METIDKLKSIRKDFKTGEYSKGLCKFSLVYGVLGPSHALLDKYKKPAKSFVLDRELSYTKVFKIRVETMPPTFFTQGFSTNFTQVYNLICKISGNEDFHLGIDQKRKTCEVKFTLNGLTVKGKAPHTDIQFIRSIDVATWLAFIEYLIIIEKGESDLTTKKIRKRLRKGMET